MGIAFFEVVDCDIGRLDIVRLGRRIQAPYYESRQFLEESKRHRAPQKRCTESKLAKPELRA